MTGCCPSHIYVHVPFCNGKCDYCAFTSDIYTPDGADAFLAAIDSELALRIGRNEPPAPETLYIGGGTPTVLPAPQLQRLLHLVQTYFDLTRLQEWTVEATPDTITHDTATAIRAAGVTRVSLGAQAFSDDVLSAIGRRHRVADIPRAVAICREAGFRELGLDLIAGLPGVDTARWRETLRQVTSLNPTHVSVYALSIDSGSRWHSYPRSSDTASDEDTVLRRLRRAEACLSAAGIERYEVSNFAQPGHECRHNLAVWRGADYLGFGPAAATRYGRHRWSNCTDIEAYTDALCAGVLPPREAETLSAEADVSERIAFAFRCREGVDLDAFCRRFSVPPALAHTWLDALTAFSSQRLVTRAGARWTPTRRGLAFADTIAAALISPPAGKPRLLLHTCCGPCATACVERLQATHAVTLFFSNSNISPEAEYRKRLDQVRELARLTRLPLVEDAYDHRAWLEHVRGLEEEPERGKRCRACFRFSLERTARYAQANGFVAFTTTLTISPHKDSPVIFAVGASWDAFLPMNFKKADGFRRSVTLADRYELYRQDTCGCEFSRAAPQEEA